VNDLMRSGVVAIFALSFGASLLACPGAPGPLDPKKPEGKSAGGACAGLDTPECGRAKGLLGAASAFGNVRHEYLLDPASSMVPGRGVQRTGGAFTVLPTRCASTRTHGDESTYGGERPSSTKVDASTIDFSYIGVAIDQSLVSAEADLAPWLSAGAEATERKVSLVAVAFVRDLDPQFFGASDDVAFNGSECSCGRATHFVGAVKMGGLISYEMTVRAGELHGHALDFVRARVAAGDTRITQTVVGGLEVDGLDGLSGSSSTSSKPLAFRVKNPVPIAYAVYPLADVCKFAFPAPEVSPNALDFGEVPGGREETRLLHVVNRASLDVRATVGERTFAIPALGSIDVPMSWRPTVTAAGCETQTREDTLQFYPRDPSAPVTPKMQSTRVVSRVRTGKPDFKRHEHIDSGSGRKPEYASTRREFTCPPDYVVASCRTEKAQCGDGSCSTDGYAVNAEPGPNGCRFGCKGPESILPGLSSNFCRFDAVMECRLRCGP
jgi:hypothetical protein